jgi:hypothetical protein
MIGIAQTRSLERASVGRKEAQTMSGSATVAEPGAVEMIFKAVERIFKIGCP